MAASSADTLFNTAPDSGGRATVRPADRFTGGIVRCRPARLPLLALTLAVTLVLCFSLPLAAAPEKDGPSSREVKNMIEFGVKLAEKGLWKEALFRWEEALRYDPENAKLYNNIAVARESMGDLEGARECYQKALEFDPSLDYLGKNIVGFEELFTALEEFKIRYSPGEEDESLAAGEQPSGETAVADESETAEEPLSGEAVVADETESADESPSGESVAVDDDSPPADGTAEVEDESPPDEPDDDAEARTGGERSVAHSARDANGVVTGRNQ